MDAITTTTTTSSTSEQSNLLLESLVAADGNTIITEIRLSDGFINATKMCKSGGKLWGHYRENATTELFLQKLSKQVNIPVSSLILSQRGGNHSGTWVHHRIALHLAWWISVDFSLQVTELVFRYLSGQVTPSESQAAARSLSRRMLVSVTNMIDMDIAQVYIRLLPVDKCSDVWPVGRPDLKLTADELAMCYIIKLGYQNTNTSRQSNHTTTMRDSQLIDSFPTDFPFVVERKVKKHLKNRQQLYEGQFEGKASRDTELVVFRSQEEYAEFVHTLQGFVAQATQTPAKWAHEQKIAEYQYLTTEAEARKVEAQLEIMRMQQSTTVPNAPAPATPAPSPPAAAPRLLQGFYTDRVCTIQEAYDEYYIGIDGKPPVSVSYYAVRHSPDPVSKMDMNYHTTRRHLPEAMQRAMENGKDIDEVVAGLTDLMRERDWSLRNMRDAFGALVSANKPDSSKINNTKSTLGDFKVMLEQRSLLEAMRRPV